MAKKRGRWRRRLSEEFPNFLAPLVSIPHKMRIGPTADLSGPFPPSVLAVVGNQGGRQETEEVSNIKEIHVGPDGQDGINFHEYPDLLEEGLEKLHHELSLSLGENETACYGFELVKNGAASFFRPLPHFFPEAGLCKPVLPDALPLDRLVRDHFNWYLLGRCDTFCPADEFAQPMRQFLQLIRWHALIRIQQGREFVGYFKIAGLGSVPADWVILHAFNHTVAHIREEIERRRLRKLLHASEFQSHLHKYIKALKDETDRGVALSHVGDMLTSHVGARFNRCAFFGLVDDDTLRCLYAHGGDGSETWARKVQHPLTQHVRSAEELLRFKAQNPDRSDDPYGMAAAPAWPAEIRGVRDGNNKNLAAMLWRHNGDVAKLPSRNQEIEHASLLMAHRGSVDRAALAVHPLAAVFDGSDPFVKETGRFPHDQLFGTRNNQHWLIPWLLQDKILGIWLLDLASWETQRHSHPNPPSLALCQEILQTFAHCFSRFHSLSTGVWMWP